MVDMSLSGILQATDNVQLVGLVSIDLIQLLQADMSFDSRMIGGSP